MFKNLYVIIFVILVSLGISGSALEAMAKTPPPSPTPVPTPTATPTPIPQVIPDLTQKSPITLGPLEAILDKQSLGQVWPKNPIKYAIRGAIKAGVPANTIVLLLLLPVIATIIAAARHLIGLRGFGIFFPAALAVVFVAIGPILGIGLFLVIVLISTTLRIILRKTKIRLQYLPRMALMIWFVALGVLGILFLAPTINWAYLSNVSIFPVLILALLAEDFTRVQLGKSAKIAINLSIETLILALVSFVFLTLLPVQKFALLNPEILLLGVFIIDFVLGKYIGLRLLEYWRFRKLIRS